MKPSCPSSDRERSLENTKQRTVSLWSYMNSSIDVYKNPLYYPQLHVLEPVASMRHIKLWKGLYCRWNPSMRAQVTISLINICVEGTLL